MYTFRILHWNTAIDKALDKNYIYINCLSLKQKRWMFSEKKDPSDLE